VGAYAAITFETLGGAGFDIADFFPEQRLVVTPLANGGDDVQFLGRGTNAVSWPITVASISDYTTLLAAQGATRRTLTKYNGSTVSNVMLLRIGPPLPHWSGRIKCEVEFKVGGP